MVQNCSVYGCTSSGKFNKDLKFHRFPRDERSEIWIKACERPDLIDKDKDKLYNMCVCSLHFEKWMYNKHKLQTAAVPVLNLPSASIHSQYTQTEENPEIEVYTHTTKVPKQTDTSAIGISAVASTSSRATQTKQMTTARERQLRKQIVSYAKKLKRVENKSKDITRQQFLQGCDKFLSPNLSKIVKAQTDLKPHSKNNRYSNEFKLYCLNMYYSNPHTYKVLSKTLCLPSTRTLTYLAIPVGTKISDYVWKVLSQAIKQLSPPERECTLCMDEMSVKSSLFNDTNKGRTIGLHEIDGAQSTNAAEYAFTIMLRGILGDWKQLVGYAFITSSKIDEALKEWIKNTMIQLFALGFKVRAIVSDQGSEFIKFSESMGISKERPYFEIDGEKVYYIFDVPHLIKCVRNNWTNHVYEFNGKTASWDDVRKCYELDIQNNSRCAPKLTEAHISPNSFQKQKLRLATQVLSNSVKEAVLSYALAGYLEPCNGTVEFIDTMDKVFDLLNSSNLDSPKPFNKPYRADELQQNLLLQVQNLLNNLIVKHKITGKNVTSSTKFINTFCITINAIVQLYDDLKNELGSDELYFLTRRLNNESLEFFFGVIRQTNGDCSKPTCVQFERAFRKSFLCQFFQLCNEST